MIDMCRIISKRIIITLIALSISVFGSLYSSAVFAAESRPESPSLPPSSLLSVFQPNAQAVSVYDRQSRAMFNSFYDAPYFGDERNFVRIMKVDYEAMRNGDSDLKVVDLQNGVELEPNSEYLVYIYYHNNATMSYSLPDPRRKDVRVCQLLSQTIETTDEQNFAIYTFKNIAKEVDDDLANSLNVNNVSYSSIVYAFGCGSLDAPAIMSASYDLEDFVNDNKDYFIDNMLERLDTYFDMLDSQATARNVRVSSSYPNKINAGEEASIFGKITFNSDEGWGALHDTAIIQSKYTMPISLIPSSLVLHNSEYGYQMLDFDLFTENGTLIGWEKMDGVIPGCAQYAGNITYILRTGDAEARADAGAEVLPIELPNTGPRWWMVGIAIALFTAAGVMFWYDAKGRELRAKRTATKSSSTGWTDYLKK